MYNAWHKELEHVQQHMLATFSVVLFLPAGDKKSQKKKNCVRHHSVSIHHKIASSKQTSPLLTPKNVATALFPASDKFLDASTHGKDAIA
jgi:hypothetical protein